MEKITSTPVNETTYTDGGWSTLLSGNYVYAVKAVYQNGESISAYGPALERSNDIDAGVSAFISPVKNVELQNEAEVIVKVTNFGEKPVGGFPVSVSMDGGEPVSAVVTATLNKGESVEVAVGRLDMNEGVHTFVASTHLDGDQVPANDACELSLPNLKNVELTGYRWDAYGNAGFMKVQTNNPEDARYMLEVTPNDALIIAGECVNGTLYAYTATWYGASKEFVELDPDTWTISRSVENTDDYVLDMAYDYKAGVMYALTPIEYDVWLAKADLETGILELIGNLGVTIRTLACSLDGTLYGVADNGAFYTIDSATAVSTLVGDTGVGKISYLQSMAFDHNTERLFWAATSDAFNGRMFEIDPATGAASPLGTALFNGKDESELVSLYAPYNHNNDGVDTVDADGTLAVDADVTGVITVASVCDADVKVYDVAGMMVGHRRVGSGVNRVKFTLGGGVYVVAVAATDGNEVTRKFIVR